MQWRFPGPTLISWTLNHSLLWCCTWCRIPPWWRSSSPARTSSWLLRVLGSGADWAAPNTATLPLLVAMGTGQGRVGRLLQLLTTRFCCQTASLHPPPAYPRHRQQAGIKGASSITSLSSESYLNPAKKTEKLAYYQTHYKQAHRRFFECRASNWPKILFIRLEKVNVCELPPWWLQEHQSGQCAECAVSHCSSPWCQPSPAALLLVFLLCRSGYK